MQDTLPPPPRPELSREAPAVERQAPPRREGAAADRTVVVNSFEFTGNSVIPTAELQALVAGHIGKPLTLDDIFTLADDLTAHYHARGYGLASVTVPAQQVTDGSVRLEVVEGRIGKISVEGNRSYSFETINKFISDLQPGEVYKTAEMERAILTLNDLPGLKVRAVIKPGATFGTSDIVLRATEEDSSDYLASFDNYGREEIGELRLLGDANFNNLGGFGDRLNVSLLYAEDSLLTYGNLAYGLPLGGSGGRLRFTLNRADYEVSEEALAGAGITGDNTNFRIDYTYPWVRTRSSNLILTTALTRTETETLVPGSPIPLNSTELNLLEAGLFWNTIFRNNSALSLSGLFSGNFKSREPTATDPQTDAQTGKLRMDVSYSLPFGRWTLVGRGAAVYSPDPLVDTQRFSIGGPYSVRGYAPATVRGDSGGQVSVELQYSFSLWQGARGTASVFADAGRVSRYEVPAEPAGDRSDSLASAGLGFGIASSSWYSANIMWATPIDNHVDPFEGTPGELEDSQVWVTFIGQF